MELRIAVPDDKVTPATVTPALETVTRLNEELIRDGTVPPFDEALKKGLVHWQNEDEPGKEKFDHAGIVLERGWGDCDDLAPWAAASDRVSGKDPGARADMYKSGPNRWHAIQRRSDGSKRDPSAEAGMRTISGISPAVVPLMHQAPSISGCESRPSLGLARIITPRGNVGYEGRCDLPFVLSSDYALSATARRKKASDAMIEAILGACIPGHVSGAADPEHIRRLDATASIFNGDDPERLIRELGRHAVEGALPFVETAYELSGDQEIGFNFGKFLNAIAPIASTALQFVPGVGPVLSKGLDFGVNLANKIANAGGDLSKILDQVHITVEANIAPMPPGGMPAGVSGVIGWNLFHAISHFASSALHDFQHIAAKLGPFGIIAAAALGIPPDPTLIGGLALALMHAHAGNKSAQEHVAAVKARGGQWPTLLEKLSDKIRAHPDFPAFNARLKHGKAAA